MDNNTIQTLLLLIQSLTLAALISYTWETRKMAAATRKSVEVAERSVAEMRAQRDAEIAPYVVAYLDGQGEINGILYLIIKNTGKTMAENVTIEFDPPLQSDHPELLEQILPADGIPSIPPGYEVRTTVTNFRRYNKDSGPMKFTVDITYFGGISYKPRKAKYNIDLRLFRGIVTTRDLTPSAEAKALGQIQASNELIVGELEKIAGALSRNPVEKT